MTTASLPNSIPARERMGISDRLAEIIFNPAAVFAEVKSMPSAPVNWLAPLWLALVTAVFSIVLTGDPLSGDKMDAALIVAVATIVGTLWAAIILWLMARLIFKTNLAFSRALEIFGLAQMIFVLGTMATTLMILATGDLQARPALSILLGHAAVGRTAVFLSAINPFHFWAAAVMSRGLSTLAGVAYGEAAFWIFGYWIVLKVALDLL
jgi:hypothetical protein